MFQLLIVDDEKSVVDGLADTFDWEKLGITVVSKAYSASEALDVLRTSQVDIMISDIRMPGMNGLEMISRVREGNKRLKIILLSGYSDFEYAQQAIRMQVDCYLLKPVKDKELTEQVKLLVDKLNEEWEQVISQQRTLYTVKENLPVLKENLLQDLIKGRKILAADYEEKRKMMSLPFHWSDRTVLLLIRMESLFLKTDQDSFSLYQYAVMNIVHEVIGERFDLWHCKDEHDYLVVMAAPSAHAGGEDYPKQLKLLEELATKAQECVKTYLKGTISIYISSWNTLAHTSQQYEGALAVMRRIAYGATEMFIAEADERLAEEAHHSITSLYSPPLLSNYLEAGRWEEATEKLQVVFAELRDNWQHSREHIMEVFFHIYGAFSRLAHKNGRSFSDWIDKQFDLVFEGTPYRSVDTMEEWTFVVLQTIKDDTTKDTRDDRKSVVAKVQSYVVEHLSVDVSTQAIAAHVFLHPVYLAKIYRLETGESIGDYIFRIRMEKAVELLSATEDKVYEIAAKLGYNNVAYFIKVFKEHYGITPQDYRDRTN